ncbi:MAG: hypothetical protein KJP18_06870, partial [Gemmatimonadetes bacterium]|nr:hypothetical protein [Gemmatimonadota bacterium]
FVGTTEVTILEVDPVTGSTTPTGETWSIHCSVTLHAFQLDGNYQTSHACVGPKGSKIEYTAIHTGQFIPLENDPDGFAFGSIDSGEILTGKGRWTCGADATGLDPVTGDFISKARLWSPEAPGLFVGGGVGRWCNCDGGDE